MIGLIRAVRRRMYKNARILGDVQAVMSGRIVKRVAHRKLGKLSRKAINKVIR